MNQNPPPFLHPPKNEIFLSTKINRDFWKGGTVGHWTYAAKSSFEAGNGVQSQRAQCPCERCEVPWVFFFKPMGAGNSGRLQKWRLGIFLFWVPPRSLTVSFPLTSYRNPIGKDRLPTTIFEGRAVKLRGCIPEYWGIMSWTYLF